MLRPACFERSRFGTPRRPLSDGLGRGPVEGRGAVTYLGGVARVDDAVRLERRLERGHLLDRGSAPDALVGVKYRAVREGERRDLVRESALVDRGSGFLV